MSSPDATSVETAAELAAAPPAYASSDGSAPTDEIGPGAGQSIARYIVLGEAGRGGMGRVLRAYDPRLRREVAIKLLRVSGSVDGRRRIIREAQAMARLSHPNIVAIYDADEFEGQPYLAMEFVEGETLAAWVGKSHGWRETLTALRQAARGLEAAHAAGIVHRDFKPANVIIGSDGRVRVTDFGIARASGTPASASSSELFVSGDDDDQLTAVGSVVGTPSYLAPELEEGAAVDVRCDVYSFCVTAWEALFGERPYRGRGRDLREAKRAGPPSMPASTLVPRWIAVLLTQGLAADPSRRPATMTELIEALARDPVRRRRSFAAVGGVVVIAACVLGAHRLLLHRGRVSCAEQASAVTEVWGATTREAVAAAFAATGVAAAEETFTRTSVWLDDYATRLLAAHEQACIAATVDGDASATTWANAQACYADRQDGLATLVDQLRVADTVVVRQAVMAAARLESVDGCSDPATLALEVAPAADQRTRVAQLRRGDAEVASMLATGRYTVARERANALATEAEALGFLPAIVSADLAVAATSAALGDYDVARQRLETAFRQAGANRLDDLAAEAAAKLALVVGTHMREHERGLVWATVAETSLDRLGVGEDLRRAPLLTNLGAVYFGMARHDEAATAYGRALAIREAEQGASHPQTAVLRVQLAMVEYELGKFDDALANAERALAIQKDSLGVDHPEVGRTLGSLGVIHLAMGDIDRALQSQTEALAIAEASEGRSDPSVAVLLVNLGTIELRRDNPDAALRHQVRALEIFEQALEPNHPNIAAALNNIGATHDQRGDLLAAKPYFERAARAIAGRLGPDHPELIASLVNVAMVELELGNPEAALTGFERALALARKHYDPSHPKLLEAMGWVGRTHVALGERALGIATLREAEAGLVGREGMAVELAQVRKWLAKAEAR